jgi:outer membrane immunogenic protein
LEHDLFPKTGIHFRDHARAASSHLLARIEASFCAGYLPWRDKRPARSSSWPARFVWLQTPGFERRFSIGCCANITAFRRESGYGVTESGIINRGLTMKKFLIATAALASVAVTAPAIAADLPVKAPPVVMPQLYNWSGFYVGFEGGAIAGVDGHYHDLFFVNNGDCFEAPQFCNDLWHPLHGGFVGGEVGFNWQPYGQRWVFGIEGDWSWSQLEESLTCEGPNTGLTTFSRFNETCGNRIDNFGTVRARIGYAFGPLGTFLAYVTGGFAWGDVQNRQGCLAAFTTPGVPCFATGGLPPAVVINPCVAPGCVPTGFPVVTDSKTHVGGAVGFGAEYGITPYLSIKGEVMWVGLGNEDHCFGIPGCRGERIINGVAVIPARVETDFVLARMGLNWRFNWFYGPGPVVARY